MAVTNVEPHTIDTESAALNSVIDEADQVNGLKAGDDAAWAAWFDAAGPRVWKYVARLTGADSSTTADIVQDVFVAAAGSLNTFDVSRGRLHPWLMGIAHRRAAAYWKKQIRESSFSQSLREHELAEILDEGVEFGLQQAEVSAAVRSVVARMPENAAAILVDHYLEGLSTGRLATELGITEQAVRSRLSRARGQFRELFQVAHREFV